AADTCYGGLRPGSKSSINGEWFRKEDRQTPRGAGCASWHLDQLGAWAGRAAKEELRWIVRRARQRGDMVHRAGAGAAVSFGCGGGRTAHRGRRLMLRTVHESCCARPVAFACSNRELRSST